MARWSYIDLESLIQLGAKLRYFAVSGINFANCRKLKPSDLVEKFPALQAFDVNGTSNNDLFCHKLFHTSRKGTFVQWKHPCKHSYKCGLSNVTLPERAMSLDWFTKTPLDFSSMSEQLARSLVVLKFKKAVITSSCHPLQNLRFIRCISRSQELSSFLEALSKSSSLEHFNLRFTINQNAAKHLRRFTSGFKNLKTVSIEARNNYNEFYFDSLPASFAISPETDNFHLRFSIPINLINSTCNNLRRLNLSVPYIKTSHFKFPNLKSFVLDCKEPKPEMVYLFRSLKNSPELKSITISQMHGSTKLNSECINELVELLQLTRKLSGLSIRFLDFVDDQHPPVKSFSIDPALYPNLSHLVYNLPASILIHDTYSSLVLTLGQRRIILDNRSPPLYFRFDRISSFEFTGSMEKLEKVNFDWNSFTTHHELILYFPNVKCIVFDFSDEEIGDLERLTFFTNILVHSKSKSLEVIFCKCKIYNFLNHLVNCDPRPEKLHVRAWDCEHGNDTFQLEQVRNLGEKLISEGSIRELNVEDEFNI